MGRERDSSHDQWREQDEDRYAHDQEYEDYTRSRTSTGRRPAHRPPYPQTPYPRTAYKRYPPPPYDRSARGPRLRRKRRLWPIFLTGCALGIVSVVLAAAVVVILTIHSVSKGGSLGNIPVLGGAKPFSKEETQTVSLATLSQVIVCDRVGNVTARVDPAASTTTITTKKTVRATGQADAEQEFGRISVEVQPPGTINKPLACLKPQATATAGTTANSTPGTTNSTSTPGATDTGGTTVGTSGGNTLTVNVTFPTTDTVSDAVDVNITVPQSVVQSNGPTMLVSIEAPLGTIHVDGLSGVLNLKGGIGDIMVKHAVLAVGSRLATTQGNVTFDGLLAAPLDTTTQGRYVLESERAIDVTLPASTNVTLDANTNAGTINSDFDIKVTNNGGAASYHGPLNTSTTATASAVLQLDVGTGNITIHKMQTG